MRSRVAIVSRDAEARLSAARAFDDAPGTWAVDIFDDVPPEADVLVLGEDVAALEATLESVCPVVRFDAERPLETVRQIERLLAPKPALYAVTSACGGAGATTVGLHLAARWNAQCLFVETASDDGPSKVGLRMGVASLYPETVDQIAPVPCGGGFLLTSVRRSEDVPTVVDLWRSDYRRFVIACPPHVAIDLAPSLHAWVCVLPPTHAGAARTRWMLDRLDDVPAAVVINRTGRGGELTRAEIREIVGRAITLELPVTPRLRDVEDAGGLLTGWSRWSTGIRRLHRALEPA